MKVSNEVVPIGILTLGQLTMLVGNTKHKNIFNVCGILHIGKSFFDFYFNHLGWVSHIGTGPDKFKVQHFLIDMESGEIRVHVKNYTHSLITMIINYEYDYQLNWKENGF